MKQRDRRKGIEAIVAVSGGPDSIYLLNLARQTSHKVVVGHFNHGARGRSSDADQRFVEGLCKNWMISVEFGKARGEAAGTLSAGGKGGVRPGFEEKARTQRYAFLKDLRARHGAEKILVAHTADDQVETVLMRILEGAGISGLKGIPRRTGDRVERPLLDTWREEILDHLRRHKIPYRTDRSNRDTRFERSWIRHVLIPILEERYGKAVKKRIFALGERFREIDAFLEATVRRWVKRNVKSGPDAAVSSFRLPRAPYAKLPSAVRKKIVQVLCFEGLEIAPNERLIEAMDKVIVSGKPSARLSIGKGASLSCRYGEAVIRSRATVEAAGPRGPVVGALVVREKDGAPARGRLKRLAAGERRAVFDADGVSGPFSIRPLRAGDRIRPFGAPARRKVKEILIDRKVPRDERWGRPVVCDANGEIVWIPGVVRSAIAPVMRETRRIVLLGIRDPSTT